MDEKWKRYPETVLDFQPAGGGTIDLRRPLDERVRAALREIGLTEPFAVVTAENPCGENAEDEPTAADEAEQRRANAARSDRLERELAAAGHHFVRVDGVAPDGDYREHAVAVVMPRAQAVALARRYRQVAIFWYDGRDFWLVGAMTDHEAERLPR